jgi:hypothetical protein
MDQLEAAGRYTPSFNGHLPLVSHRMRSYLIDRKEVMTLLEFISRLEQISEAPSEAQYERLACEMEVGYVREPETIDYDIIPYIIGVIHAGIGRMSYSKLRVLFCTLIAVADLQRGRFAKALGVASALFESWDEEDPDILFLIEDFQEAYKGD